MTEKEVVKSGQLKNKIFHKKIKIPLIYKFR